MIYFLSVKRSECMLVMVPYTKIEKREENKNYRKSASISILKYRSSRQSHLHLYFKKNEKKKDFYLKIL